MASAPWPVPKLLVQPKPCASRSRAFGFGALVGFGRRRRASCRRCGRRRSARRSPRRSSPCGRRSRGCPWPRRRGSPIAVRAFRIDVDQAHLGRRRAGSRDRARRNSGVVGSCGEPGGLGAPVARRWSGSQASSRPPAKPKVRKPMVSSATLPVRIMQVGPRDLLAVLLLDRPEQAARLVDVDVVRPAS